MRFSLHPNFNRSQIKTVAILVVVVRLVLFQLIYPLLHECLPLRLLLLHLRGGHVVQGREVHPLGGVGVEQVVAALGGLQVGVGRGVGHGQQIHGGSMLYFDCECICVAARTFFFFLSSFGELVYFSLCSDIGIMKRGKFDRGFFRIIVLWKLAPFERNQV